VPGRHPRFAAGGRAIGEPRHAARPRRGRRRSTTSRGCGRCWAPRCRRSCGR
jgi:hypothetical protein